MKATESIVIVNHVTEALFERSQSRISKKFRIEPEQTFAGKNLSHHKNNRSRLEEIMSWMDCSGKVDLTSSKIGSQLHNGRGGTKRSKRSPQKIEEKFFENPNT